MYALTGYNDVITLYCINSWIRYQNDYGYLDRISNMLMHFLGPSLSHW